MATSTIPAAKAAVWNILAARGALATVSRQWAMPTKDEDYSQDRMIFFGETAGTDDWGALGQHRRDEEYAIRLIVYAEDWGDDPQTTEDALFALWAEVTDALRDDLTTPGSLLRAAGVFKYDRITFTQTTNPVSPEKWGSSIDGRITFQARYTP